MEKLTGRKLIINPGKVPIYEGSRKYQMYCQIKYKDKKLSISGVIGPKHTGNCYGGCGQIDMEFKHRNPDHDDDRYNNPTHPRDIVFNEGWTRDKWYTFLEYWKLYHLNDMQAGCRHQRFANWGKNKVQLVKVKFNYWKLPSKNWEACKQDDKRISNMKTPAGIKSALVQTAAGKYFKKAKLLALQGIIYAPDHDTEPYAVDLIKKQVIKFELEKKHTGWIYESEHPEGVLSKACPVCGYKYGSAWRMLEVPQDVIDFLFSLPPTKNTPAWV